MSIVYDDSDLQKMTLRMKALGGVPQKCVTKAAKKSSNVVLKAARRMAPVGKTGNLQKSLCSVGEKFKKKGKKVYQVTFSSDMNDVLRKPIKQPGKYDGKNKTGYYPMSLIFSFKTAKSNGYKAKSGKVPNDFLDRAAKEQEAAAYETMMGTLEKEVDKVWAKK